MQKSRYYIHIDNYNGSYGYIRHSQDEGTAASVTQEYSS